MKHINLLLIGLLISISSFGQGLKDYSDIINIDDEYQTTQSNLNELKKFDLSGFWIDNESERRFGFIGDNYRRLHIIYLSIIKNPNDSLMYLVYGKSMASGNICQFQGVIQIKASYYIKSFENPKGNNGILAGEYTFFENPKSPHSGTFKGRFASYWYKDENGNIKYNDRWSVSDLYNNNQFAGTWTEYGKEKALKANWGDSRIPLSGDLDDGTGEFCPAKKYAAFGWDSYLKAWGYDPDSPDAEKARKIESEKWWIDK